MEAGINWLDEKIVDGPYAFAAMSTARERSLVRKHLRDKFGDDVISPGKIYPTDCVKWEKRLEKKLISISGINRVPIFYVTRVKYLADAEDLLDTPFIMKTVLLAPLIQTSFEADSREVHRIIVARTTGTDAEQFLKSFAKYECGCRDTNIIRAFNEGTGSNT